MTDAPSVDGNRLSLLTEGPERLEAVVALIEGATRTLRLLYYIWEEDEAGARVRDALIAARRRGVTVGLIVDAMGSDASGHDAFFQPLQDADIEVCLFHPRWGRRYLLRNHQKLALADEACAIIGGFNVGRDYFKATGETAWRDLGLLIEGPAAARLAGYFDALQDWTQRPKSRMRDLRRALKRWSNPDGNVRWLMGGPTRRLSAWARCLREDLNRGGRIDIIAAYFAPSPAMLARLDRAGRRGPVRILTAAKTDNLATIGAARFTYKGLLKKGVRVFEYQPCRLHTKLYVFDGVVHIGSANFDMRSLFLNLEIMLRVKDAAFAAHCRAYVEGEIGNAREIVMADVTGWRTWGARLRWALSYFVVAVLDYNVSRRLNLDIDL